MVSSVPELDDCIRPFAPSDRDACLALFDGNVPAFFDPCERMEFARFLDRQAVSLSYRVIERSGRLVACGGFTIEEAGRTAALCWGMVDRSLHGMGLGAALTRARLLAAAQTPGVRTVTLATSQHTHSFYARFGFETVAVTADGFAPGLDRYDMRLVLSTI